MGLEMESGAGTGLSDIAVEFCMFLAVFHFWLRDLLYS